MLGCSVYVGMLAMAESDALALTHVPANKHTN